MFILVRCYELETNSWYVWTYTANKTDSSSFSQPHGQYGQPVPVRRRPSIKSNSIPNNCSNKELDDRTSNTEINTFIGSVSRKGCSGINSGLWSSRIGAEASSVRRCFNKDRRGDVLGDAGSSFSLPSSVGVREEQEELHNNHDKSINASVVSSCLSSAFSQLSRSLITNGKINVLIVVL